MVTPKLTHIATRRHPALLWRKNQICCGSRMFWFDKQDERAVFSDIRAEDAEKHPVPGCEAT